MCGVIGVFIKNIDNVIIEFIDNLFIESEIRGLHASGITYVKDGLINTISKPISASQFLKDFDIRTCAEDNTICLIGHVRYSTSDLSYNQPISGSDRSIVHNGVITQETPDKWCDLYDIEKFETKNDSEIVLRYLEKGLEPLKDLNTGSMAVCEINVLKTITAYRNGHRPLWCTKFKNGVVFSSTRNILERAIKRSNIGNIADFDIFQLECCKKYIVDSSLILKICDLELKFKDLQVKEKLNMRNYTYGIELELADIDTTKVLPEGCSYSSDFDIVNSNGVAVDPSKKVITYGGEVITPPMNSIESSIAKVSEIFDTFPESNINHRTMVHIHISWDGLRDDLDAMKKILTYQAVNGMKIIEKIWNHTKDPKMNRRAWAFQIYDASVMTGYKYEECLKAQTVEEFRRAHALTKDGSINWRLTRRHAVNLYSLFKHGTVEFRHFFASKDLYEIRCCFEFVTKYIEEALGSRRPIEEVFAENTHWKFPKESPFSEELENGWQNTNFHFNDKNVAIENINRVLNDETL